MNIYYLDDEAALCEIFTEFLTDDQTNITTFTDAKEAISQCEQDPPDLMFIDYRLKDTSGDRVAEQIDAQILKCLVSGELEIPHKEQFVEMVSKPFKLDQIRQIVEKYRK
jgi:CheY-like chemotaxis protein